MLWWCVECIVKEISEATVRHRQINKHKSHWPKRLKCECVISITLKHPSCVFVLPEYLMSSDRRKEKKE